MSTHLNLLSFTSYSRLPFLLGLMGSLYYWNRENSPCCLHVLSRNFPDWLNRQLESYEGVLLHPLVHLESESETACERVDSIGSLHDLSLLLEHGAKLLDHTAAPLMLLPGDFLVLGDLTTLSSSEFDVVLSTSLNHAVHVNEGKHEEGTALSLILPALYCHPSQGSIRFLQAWSVRLKALQARLQKSLHFSQESLVQGVAGSLKESLEVGLSEHKLAVGTPMPSKNTSSSINDSKHLGVYPLGFSVGHSNFGVTDYWKVFQGEANSNFEFGPAYIDHLLLEKWYADILYGS